MREKINYFLINVGQEIEYGLRQLYGRPSLLKQFIIVVVLGCVLSSVSIYTLVTSIYNMGKHDAENRFIELQHIKSLELQKRNDSTSVN